MVILYESNVMFFVCNLVVLEFRGNKGVYF